MSNIINKMTAKARVSVYKFFHEESGEVNIVAIVMLIAVAVVLALAFKDAIADLLKNLFDGIGTEMEKATEEVTL